MSGYAFHPGALADFDEIWEYIAQDNIEGPIELLPTSTSFSAP